MKLYFQIKSSKNLYIAYAIILLTFLFSRLPFFIWMPIPVISPDTFDYYTIVQNLLNGSFKGFGILPPGFILFLYLMELFLAKTFYILVLQNIFSFMVCLFFISVTSKFYKNITIPVAIALAIYMMDSFCMRFDFALLPESLYRNSLIAVAGLLLLIVNSKKNPYWLLLSIFIIFPPLFRSNGLYIYFLPLFVLLFLLLNKYSFRYYLLLFLPILILNILWSAYNYSTENRFLPGNPDRLNSIVNTMSGDRSDAIGIQPALKNIYNKATLFIDLTTFISENRPQFYYINLVNTYREYYISDIMHDTSYKRADWTVHIDSVLMKLALKEIYTEPNKYSEVIVNFDAVKSHNLWLKAYHIYYKVHSFMFNNYFWLLSFFIIYLVSAWKIIKSRFKNKSAFMLFCFGSIHFMAILSLTFFGWYQPRYIQVTEYIVYICVAFSPLLFDFKKVLLWLKK